MLARVPTFGQGDPQDISAAIRSANAKDAVEIIANQAQASDIQVVLIEGVDGELAQSACLPPNSEG